MTYTLIAIFLATGQTYIERPGLSLHTCAARAAMARQEASEVFQFVGEVKYHCVPERSLARSETEMRE
jgi:hypothetical protein